MCAGAGGRNTRVQLPTTHSNLVRASSDVGSRASTQEAWQQALDRLKMALPVDLIANEAFEMEESILENEPSALRALLPTDSVAMRSQSELYSRLLSSQPSSCSSLPTLVMNRLVTPQCMSMTR